MKESKVIEDLHKIRERHFNETKGMSPDVFLKNLKEQIAPLKKALSENRKTKTESHHV